MAAYLRPSLKVAGVAALGAGLGYNGYRYWQTTHFFWNDVYAEGFPSDAKTGLKKMEWKGFTELKLVSAEQYNHNVKRLTFALPDDQTVTGISPITSLLTRHTPDGGFIPVFRPYTPVSDNDLPGTVSFMIKKYPNGKGSSKMHSLKPGDSMKFKPLHEFDYKPNEFQHLTFIAGGSGITPIYQLTRFILNNPEDKTKLALVYANNTEEDILLRKEFDDLAAKYPERFQRVYTVTTLGANTDGTVEQGYVNKQTLSKVMPHKLSGSSQKVLVSGPPPMVEAIAGAKGGFGWTQGSIGGILAELGYSKEEVHKF